jgi:predicted house-cleaning noncanonical NTP pyrophosphatase (MazG superfamily)
MANKRFLLDKLGRDKALELFNNDGCDLKYHIIESNEEYLEAITKKIFEELEEVLAAETKEELTEELGDLEEVLDALKKLTKIDQAAIDESRKNKREKKGGFEKRIYLHYVDAPEESWVHNHLSSSPEKYPEIVDEIELP